MPVTGLTRRIGASNLPRFRAESSLYQVVLYSPGPIRSAFLNQLLLEYGPVTISICGYCEAKQTKGCVLRGIIIVSNDPQPQSISCFQLCYRTQGMRLVITLVFSHHSSCIDLCRDLGFWFSRTRTSLIPSAAGRPPAVLGCNRLYEVRPYGAVFYSVMDARFRGYRNMDLTSYSKNVSKKQKKKVILFRTNSETDILTCW